MYNIFTNVKIGPFTDKETKDLIESSLKEYRISNIQRIAEKTYNYSGGIPYYVQAIGYEIIENYFNYKNQEDLFEVSIKGLLEKLSTSYPIVLENLAPNEKIAIVSIANNLAPPDVCAKNLFETDLISRSKEEWIIPAQIEKEWIINLSERLLSSAGEELWEKYGAHVELPKLVNEIEMIYKELSMRGKKINSLIIASDAAKSKNGAKALAYLGSAGKWALDTATQIGTEVAAEAIKVSLGVK